MLIVDKILNLLRSVDGIETVLYESGFGTNVRLDRKPTPSAILYLLQQYTVDLVKGVKREILDVEVFVCDRADLAAKGEVVQQKLDTIKPLVDQFIALLVGERTLLLDGDSIDVTMAYGKFDANVVGYSLQFKVSERQATCFDSDASGVNQIVIKKNGTVDVAAYGEALVNVVDGEILLQNKTATTNGIVTFDDGYNGLQSVTVNVQAPAPEIRLQEKTTATNGYITFDSGYDGLQGVSVNVPQPQGTLQRTITENGTTNIDIANYQTIEITTNVPTGSTCDLYTGLTVEANGVYNPATYNKDGFSTFVVNIPQPQGTLRRTITQNGVETVDVRLWENIEITTAVPDVPCQLETLNITAAPSQLQPTYTPSGEGFDQVNINLQLSEKYETYTLQSQFDSVQYDVRDNDYIEITLDASGLPAQCQGTLPVTITNTGIETVNCCGYESVSIDTTQIASVNTWKGTWAQYQAIFPKDTDTLYLITD